MGRVRDHARRHRRVGGDARVSLRALERSAHRWRMAVHDHRARSAAGRRYRGRASRGTLALARRPGLHRDGTGEPSGRVAAGLYRSASQRRNRVDRDRHASCHADRSLAVLQSGAARLDAGIRCRARAADRARDPPRDAGLPRFSRDRVSRAGAPRDRCVRQPARVRVLSRQHSRDDRPRDLVRFRAPAWPRDGRAARKQYALYRGAIVRHERRLQAARAPPERHRVHVPYARRDAEAGAGNVGASAPGDSALVRPVAAGTRRRRAVPGVSRAPERGRVESSRRRRQPARHLLPLDVRSAAQVARRPRGAVVPRNDPRPSPAGHDRARTGRYDSRHRALFLVDGHGGGVGRVRRAARGRNGIVFLGHRAFRDARRHHALGGVARRGHGDPRVWVDAHAVDRLHPRAHARAVAQGRGRRGSLSRLAGAGLVVRTGPAGDPPAPCVRSASVGRAIRRPRLSRPRAGERRGAAPDAPCHDRAMDRRLALGVALLVGAQHAAPLQAQREGVLKQIDLPHAYYWREMYVPQATSGPSSATWSPDGTQLIYSMQGSLWRQRIGSRVAEQLTSESGYDYQPDWSPDGRSVVFARYAHDAIELEVLNLASGAITALTANHAVNVEPRWSPDGSRIVFVSSIYNGRWHIFIVAADRVGAQNAAPLRITDDNDSKLSRYYYSKWDHYISPTWSPDGKEIILVSNRGHIHGTGGFWRMDARPAAPLRELR